MTKILLIGLILGFVWGFFVSESLIRAQRRKTLISCHEFCNDFAPKNDRHQLFCKTSCDDIIGSGHCTKLPFVVSR